MANDDHERVGLLKFNSVSGREAAYGLANERFEGLGDYNAVCPKLTPRKDRNDRIELVGVHDGLGAAQAAANSMSMATRGSNLKRPMSSFANSRDCLAIKCEGAPPRRGRR